MAMLDESVSENSNSDSLTSISDTFPSLDDLLEGLTDNTDVDSTISAYPDLEDVPETDDEDNLETPLIGRKIKTRKNTNLQLTGMKSVWESTGTMETLHTPPHSKPEC